MPTKVFGQEAHIIKCTPHARTHTAMSLLVILIHVSFFITIASAGNIDKYVLSMVDSEAFNETIAKVIEGVGRR